jgi:hypothetical protein
VFTIWSSEHLWFYIAAKLKYWASHVASKMGSLSLTIAYKKVQYQRLTTNNNKTSCPETTSQRWTQTTSSQMIRGYFWGGWTVYVIRKTFLSQSTLFPLDDPFYPYLKVFGVLEFFNEALSIFLSRHLRLLESLTLCHNRRFIAFFLLQLRCYISFSCGGVTDWIWRHIESLMPDEA